MMNKSMRCLAMLFTALMLWNQSYTPVWGAAALTPDSLEQAMDDLMSTGLEQLHIPGAAVVVTKGEDIFFSKGYGYADLERSTAFDSAQTIVPVGSLTKSFSASAAMQLVERGQLDLHEDINRYLRSYQASQYDNHPFHMHHLLTHTSGLDEAVYGINSHTPTGALTAEEYLRDYFQKQPPIREPGSQYDYSNVAYGLIGNVVEQVSGQQLNDYFKAKLFAPMDMPSATLDVPVDNPKLAQSYYWQDGSYEKQPFSYIHLPGAGALSVTPKEFSHYLITHLNEGLYGGQRVLKSDTVAAMHAQQFAVDERLDGVGYGFFRGELENGIPMLWATGEIDGFISEMVLIPSHELGIFVTVNAANSGLALHGAVVNAIAERLPAEEQADTSKSLQTAVNEEDNLPEEVAGVYQATLNPVHGWGKWIRMLGSMKYTVSLQDEHTLIVNGEFPNENQTTDRVFQTAGDGLLVEKEGSNRLLLYQQDGVWTLIAPDSKTFKQTAIWHQSRMLLINYAAASLFFILALLVWVVRYVNRAIRRTQARISTSLAVIALLNTVFLGVQFIYGNSQIVYGYPAWYIWGICTLPLISALIAMWVIIVNANKLLRGEGRGRSTGKIMFAVITLLHTIYLYYWNFLPIHYT